MEIAPAQSPTPAEPQAAVFLRRSSSWVVGVDLGQSTDPTAICVLEWIKGVLDPNSEWERHTGTGRLPQKPTERLDVRHLVRRRRPQLKQRPNPPPCGTLRPPAAPSG